MGHTIAEKILSDTAGREVSPGEIIKAEYDLAATHDLSTPGTLNVAEEMEGEIADPDRLAVVPDHMVPAHNDVAQQNYTRTKKFAEEHGIEKFYPQGETGLMHAVLPEDGLVKPGDIVIGADSHTTTYGAMGVFSTGVGLTDMAFAWLNGWTWLRVPETLRLDYTGQPSEWTRGKDIILHTLDEIGVDGAVYKSVEFAGSTISELPMDDRFSMSNMILEGGAKTGFVEPDATTEKYVEERVDDEYTLYSSDEDANYWKTVDFDCEGLEPQVAVPHLPENVKPVTGVAGTEIDQAVVGSCTNCRLEDLQQAAEILEGKEIDRDVRMIITPGSRRIQTQAFEQGWMETFHRAGADIGSPGCGACFGERIGVLDEDEVAISTTNRNFIGRMGPKSSEVYLSNPAVAAASAVAGEIVHPEEVAQ
jgi:3-isopropylmalate/(R)-2-methylmalate dehydratase large subunit